MSSKTDILVVGESWDGLLLAHSLYECGIASTVLLTESLEENPQAVNLHIGNGELYSYVHATFGKDLAQHLWDLSLKNFERAKFLLSQVKVPYVSKDLFWFAKDSQEAGKFEQTAHLRKESRFLGRDERCQQGEVLFEALLEEPAIHFSKYHLCRVLKEFLEGQGLTVLEGANVSSIENKGFSKFRIRCKRGPAQELFESSAVVLSSPRVFGEFYSEYADEVLVVTLSSFETSLPPKFPFSIALFHGGADVVWATTAGSAFSSFRNLFQDSGIGVLKKADPKTRKGVEAFFGQLGWLPLKTSLVPRLRVTSMGCDGVPLVGTFAETQGVYFIGGFAAREANFLFAVAQEFAKTLAQSQPSGVLERFSTKRFV